MANQNFDDNTRSVGENTAQMQENTNVQRALNAENKAAIKTQAELNRAKFEAQQALKGFTRSLFSIEQGMGKYGDSIRSGSNALGTLVQQFGKTGLVIGGLIKVVGAITDTVLKQNDAFLEAKDSLQQFGLNSSMTAQEIGKMGLAAGFSWKELGKYTEAVRSLGTDTIALGQNVGDGVKKFGEITAVGSTVIATFSKLGINNEQLVKNQAQYIKLLSQQGIQITGQLKDTDFLRRSSLDYTRNLITLAALSGEDIDTIRKRQEAARSECVFQLNQAMMAKEAAELEARAGDQAAQARAKELRQTIDRNEQMQDIAGMMGIAGQDLAAFNQMLATGTFTELSAKFAPFGAGILELIKDIQEGRKEATALAPFIAKMQDRTMETMGNALKLNYNELSGAVLTNSEMIKKSAQLRGMSEEDYVKMVEKEIAKRKKEEKESADVLARAREAQIINEKNLQAVSQRLYDMVRGPITRAFELFQKMLNWTAHTLAKIVKRFGGPDFTDLFDTTEEAINKLVDAQKALDEQKARQAAATGPAAAVEAQKTQAMAATVAQRRQEVEAQRARAGAPALVQTSAEDLIKIHGLKLKPGGDRQAAGAGLDPRLIELAQQVQQQPGFTGFTGFNDRFHQEKSPGSLHTIGRAFDFQVDAYSSDLAKQYKKIVEQSIPGARFFDEYASPSSGSTGGHFHVDLGMGARRGIMPNLPGILNAPSSGTLMAVHNRELIAPLDPDSIIARLLMAKPSEAEGIIQAAAGTGQSADQIRYIAEVLAEKLDDVIDKLSNSNNTQEDMLKYMRA